MFVLVDKKQIPDGMGGIKTTLEDGEKFLALLSTDSSTSARIAEQQGFKSIFTVFVAKDLKLKFDQVIKRSRDDQLFVITSNPDDKMTPKMSRMNFKTASAKYYKVGEPN